jgi:L-2-aminoadipate reductase
VSASLRSATPLPSLKLLVRYNQLLFSAERVSCFIDQLEQIVIDAASHPEKSVGALNILTEGQRKVLPEPTRDLHWGQFRGPIHEIFSENVQRHPERHCVVETASNSSSQDKIFTYRHIHEASNVLAHCLVAHKVDRGDVVMVYAYRGVDLVVAVMGILKAGATFSVIGIILGSLAHCVLIYG